MAGSVASGLITLGAYAYLFFAVHVNNVEHLKRALYSVGGAWICYIIINTAVVLSIDYNKLSDEAGIPSDILKQAMAGQLGGQIVMSFIFAAFTIGFTHQYRQYLLRMRNNTGNVVHMNPTNMTVKSQKTVY